MRLSEGENMKQSVAPDIVSSMFEKGALGRVRRTELPGRIRKSVHCLSAGTKPDQAWQSGQGRGVSASRLYAGWGGYFFIRPEWPGGFGHTAPQEARLVLA